MSGMFFRSEKMNYYELRVSYDSAWAVLGGLGTLSALEFEDRNHHVAAMNRPFVNYLKRLQAMTEKLNFLAALYETSEQKLVKSDEYLQFANGVSEGIDISVRNGDAYLDVLENEVNNRWTALKRNTETLIQLKSKYYDLVEQKYVFTLIKPVLPQSFGMYFNAGAEPHQQAEEVRSIRFCYICGVIKAEDVEKFQKLIYRISRGNSFLKLIDLPAEKDDKGNWINVELSEQGSPIQKSLFFLAFQIGIGDQLRVKYQKLCDSFGVRRYNLPPDFIKMEDEIATLDNEILNLQKIRQTTDAEINQDLIELAERKPDMVASYIEELRMKVLREKCIYEAYDRMKLKDKIFFGRVWIPIVYEPQVRRVLDKFARTFNFSPPELELKDWQVLHKKPPTFYRTNDFTKPYLEIVETYGVPRYLELNPAPWSIATFPYQFGVMFGDIGHGGLLFAAASAFVYKADELRAKKMVPKKALEIRYLIWLMGFMAFYCGIIYNEFFAIPLKIFGTCHDEHTLERDRSCIYPIGLDPAWYIAKNEVSYFNSFKMKLSIIIGVLHMMLGIFLRGANNIYFGLYVDFIFEFIPQVLFMSCTFGYMVVMIIVKWLQDWEGKTPPSILNIYTGMGITVVFYDKDS